MKRQPISVTRQLSLSYTCTSKKIKLRENVDLAVFYAFKKNVHLKKSTLELVDLFGSDIRKPKQLNRTSGLQ